jgi:hypothetical protein
MSKNTEVVRVSLNLSRDEVETLRDIAFQRNTTMTDVLRHAVLLERFVNEATKNKEKILVEKPDGKIRELVFG